MLDGRGGDQEEEKLRNLHLQNAAQNRWKAPLLAIGIIFPVCAFFLGAVAPADAARLVGTRGLDHSCSRPEESAQLLAQVPSEATVMDLVWIGQEALGDEPPPLDAEKLVRVAPGETFLGILNEIGVPRNEARAWYASSRKVFDLARLRVGRELRLSFGPGGHLLGLEYQIDQMNVLLAERGEDGSIVSRRGEIPATTEVRGISGQISSNITADCLAAGVPARVVRQLARIFEGEVDFRKLRKGDAFRLLYEVKVTADGEMVQQGSAVLAGEVEIRGKTHTALRAESPRGGITFVNLQGVPLRDGSSKLRYPVKFTRISSRFSTSRLHPKTNRRRPHLGVDFAAPRGTSIHAVADGKVQFAKWYGQMGRTVRIDHGSALRYDSMYGHMTRFASGIGPGTFVRKGQVIGYVGSTGLATGPHLHFSLVEGKRYVDPLKALRNARLQAPKPLSGDRFEKRKTLLVSALGALDAGPVRLKSLADVRDL